MSIEHVRNILAFNMVVDECIYSLQCQPEVLQKQKHSRPGIMTGFGNTDYVRIGRPSNKVCFEAPATATTMLPVGMYAVSSLSPFHLQFWFYINKCKFWQFYGDIYLV